MSENELLRVQFLDHKLEQYSKKSGKKNQKESNPLIPLAQGQRYGFIYSRVSTQYQADKGHSLDHQDKQLSDYCERNNIIVLEKYCDEGISGTTIKHRHALGKMLSDLKPNYVVVCSTCSRLSRNTQDLLEIHKQVASANASLIILDIQLDTNTPIGKMILTIMSSLGQFEVEQTSERVKKVMNHLSSEGKLITKPCYGYVRVNKELVEKPDEQIVIKVIKNLLKEYPNINVNQITNILNKRGFTNRKEKPFHASTVKSIIDNINNVLKKVDVEMEPNDQTAKKIVKNLTDAIDQKNLTEYYSNLPPESHHYNQTNANPYYTTPYYNQNIPYNQNYNQYPPMINQPYINQPYPNNQYYPPPTQYPYAYNQYQSYIYQIPPIENSSLINYEIQDQIPIINEIKDDSNIETNKTN